MRSESRAELAATVTRWEDVSFSLSLSAIEQPTFETAKQGEVAYTLNSRNR